MLAILETCLLVVGVVGASALVDRYASDRFAAALATTAAEASVEQPAAGDVIGRLEIPASPSRR